jgi:predicted DNA repair protein MutK
VVCLAVIHTERLPAQAAWQGSLTVAVSSLLVLIDDIALVLDDVALMSKVAAKKTAGVLGDDLALNAQQVAGIRAERELPVVWAVAKGSVRNKVILVPAALAISAFAPWAVTPLLMLGGAYLCFEGVEKLVHPLLHPGDEAAHHQALSHALADAELDMVAFEREKIDGAVRTDFILSAEIVAITLGTVATAPLSQQVVVISGVSLLVTAGVYGLVAAIVKTDDLGLYLSRLPGQGWLAVLRRRLGLMLLSAAPLMMKTLSVVGTVAMFLVGGGIVLHGLPGAHALVQAAEHLAGGLPAVGAAVQALTPLLVDGLGGVLVGAAALVLVKLGQAVAKLFRRR